MSVREDHRAPRLLVLTRDPDVREAVSAVLESSGYETTIDPRDRSAVAAVVVAREAATGEALGAPAGLPIARISLERELEGAPSLMLPEVRTALLTKVAGAIGAAASGARADVT